MKFKIGDLINGPSDTKGIKANSYFGLIVNIKEKRFYVVQWIIPVNFLEDTSTEDEEERYELHGTSWHIENYFSVI